MFQRFHEVREREGGFTLIELLVVILIVAILAAVAIPVFLRQRQKGYVDQMESALKNAATAEESFATGNDGSYTSSLTALENEGFQPTNQVTFIDPILVDTDSFCLEVDHALHDDNYAYSNATQAAQAGKPVAGNCGDANGSSIPAP